MIKSYIFVTLKAKRGENRMIDKDSKVSEIKEKKEIISAVEEIAKVKGADLLLSDEVTMSDLAKKLGMDIEDLLLVVNEKNGSADEFYELYPKMRKAKEKSGERPDWLMSNEVVDLDVRPSLAKGVDPFGLIMQHINELNGRVLHIINSFETTPLYNVLGKQGFKHYSEVKNGVWHIYFFKT